MIGINDIQAAVIAKLKADALVVAKVSSSAEIREDQWQGILHSYPAIRVAVGSITELQIQNNCDIWRIDFSVIVFSEEASSYECNEIAKVVAESLHKKSFTYATIVFTTIYCTSINSAERRDEKTWVTSVQFTAMIYEK